MKSRTSFTALPTRSCTAYSECKARPLQYNVARLASSFIMAADPFASELALQAAVDRELADVATALKARDDLDASQIDAPAPVPTDEGSDEAAGDLSTPDSSREGTPDGSGNSSSSCMPSSLSRHSATSARTPLCGRWSQARAALSGNVGRVLICLRNFAGEVTALPQRHAAMQQQLLAWLRDSLLPLLHGFADCSLAFADANVPAVCAVVQRLVNAHAALMALDPPQPPRSRGEQAVQILVYIYFSDYLSREGVRLDGHGQGQGLGQDACLFAVSSAPCSNLIVLCMHGPACTVHASQHSQSSVARSC